MHVFSTEPVDYAHDSAGDPAHNNQHPGQGERAVAVVGRIEQECNLRPVIDDAYRAVLRERDLAANKPKRSIQLLDAESEARTGFIPHIRESELTSRTHRKRLEVDAKRERLPRDEVTDMLFRAFERRSLWTFAALVDHTRQPSSFLKEILSDIAVYNTRGPNKNLYELKAEYRNGALPAGSMEIVEEPL
jgi:transcription initiation factor TFIIF subunit beta